MSVINTMNTTNDTNTSVITNKYKPKKQPLDYSLLESMKFHELKKMAKDMGLNNRKSRIRYMDDIKEAFREYEKYVADKVDKYIKVKHISRKGKNSNVYLVTDPRDKEYVMKTFRLSKSSKALKVEYVLQKIASKENIAPRVVEYDTVSKYIVMEKMEHNLIDLVVKKQKGVMFKYQQLNIIDILRKMDDIHIYHANTDINNYMVKNKRIYLIDYSMAKDMTSKLCKKLGTDTPNMDFALPKLIQKMKDLNLHSNSWKYLDK